MRASGLVERARSILGRIDPRARLHLHEQLLEQVTHEVVALDREYHVLFWSSGAEKLYGVSRCEALGVLVSELYGWEWLVADSEAEAREQLAATGHWRGENIHILRSGRRIHVESTVSVLRDA